MSPTVHSEAGFQFYFVMGDLRESPHIHVRGSSGHAKIWLDPIGAARVSGFNRAETSRILDIVEKQKEDFLRGWNDESARAGH
jgi:hypothetical protein